MLESRDPDCRLHGQSLGRPWDTPDIYDSFRDVLIVSTDGNHKFRHEIHPPPGISCQYNSVSSFDSCSFFLLLRIREAQNGFGRVLIIGRNLYL
jgi:hypothetical protein